MLSVVLADDENKILLLLQKLIDWESLGYEIAGTANDGLRALELVREKQPDLLITDVRMPGCSGIERVSDGGGEAVLYKDSKGNRAAAGYVRESPLHRVPGQPAGLF